VRFVSNSEADFTEEQLSKIFIRTSDGEVLNALDLANREIAEEQTRVAKMFGVSLEEASENIQKATRLLQELPESYVQPLYDRLNAHEDREKKIVTPEFYKNRETRRKEARQNRKQHKNK